jgi:hypothetical protein
MENLLMNRINAVQVLRSRIKCGTGPAGLIELQLRSPKKITYKQQPARTHRLFLHPDTFLRY